MSNKPTLRDADPHDFDGLKTRVVELLAKGKSVNYIAKLTGENYEKIRKIALSYYDSEVQYRNLLKVEHTYAVRWVMDQLKEKIEKDIEAGKPISRADSETLLKYFDHNAKLHGLYAATEHNVQVTVEDLSDEEVIAQLKAKAPELFVLDNHSPLQALPPSPQIEDAQFEVINVATHRQPSPSQEAGPDQR